MFEKVLLNWFFDALNLLQHSQAKVHSAINILMPSIGFYRGSTISNGRELESYLDRVFNSKLGSFASRQHFCLGYMQPLLVLKTQHRIRPNN